MRRRSTAGFTLIELLVVVAVIGILAALLMPAILRGMAASQSASCKSNLHQIGSAFANYYQQYAGVMAAHDDEPQNPPKWLDNNLWWRSVHGHLIPLMGGAHAVYRCPADVGIAEELGSKKWFSYTFNTKIGIFAHGNKTWRHHNVAEVRNPSALIVFLDGGEGDGGTDGNNDRPYQPGGLSKSYEFDRHNDGFNALYLEGHVDHHQLGDTKETNYKL
ncbi:MAG: type II secretion system protein [Planctomycetota bacterium]